MDNIQNIIFIIFVVVFTPMLYMKLAGESPKPLRKLISAIVVLILVFVFSFIYHMITSKAFIASFNSAYDKAQYYKIAETPNSMEFGCVKQEQLATIEKLAQNDDVEKFKKYFLKQIEKGSCIVFSETEELKLIETEIFSGYVLIERKNSKIKYWTDISTLREK